MSLTSTVHFAFASQPVCRLVMTMGLYGFSNFSMNSAVDIMVPSTLSHVSFRETACQSQGNLLAKDNVSQPKLFNSEEKIECYQPATNLCNFFLINLVGICSWRRPIVGVSVYQAISALRDDGRCYSRCWTSPTLSLMKTKIASWMRPKITERKITRGLYRTESGLNSSLLVCLSFSVTDRDVNHYHQSGSNANHKRRLRGFHCQSPRCGFVTDVDFHLLQPQGFSALARLDVSSSMSWLSNVPQICGEGEGSCVRLGRDSKWNFAAILTSQLIR